MCYTRGSVIPLSLNIQANDSKTVQCLANPSAIRVKLERRIRFFNTPSTLKPTSSWFETVDTVGSAVWWPVGATNNTDTSRILEGEIKLAKDLRPTTSVGHFSISVCVLFHFLCELC
jgi:hypothetical protein